jgi:dTDP-glucose pyrophosphorylase
MYKWKKAIISQTDTMETAIKVLELESLRIVMVVDKNDRFVGTVTDGDIRRGLIKRLTMDTAIIDIMFKESIVASVKDDKASILAKMRELDILQIPIIDDDGKIIGLETLQHLLKDKRHDNPIFLMAGGFGKRLQPLTNNIPKPLLTIGKKPILENILEQFIAAGFHCFYISTHFKSEMVQEHFGDGSDWGVTIEYVHEDIPLGTAGGLGLLPDNLPDLPILMMNGDLLTKIDFEKLLHFHMQSNGIATMCVRKYDFQVPYGVIQSEDQKVVGIVEKPMHSFFVNAGIYVLESDLVKNISGKSHIDMTNLLEDQIHKGMSINMFPIYEYWLDIGQKDQLEQARIDYKSFQ